MAERTTLANGLASPGAAARPNSPFSSYPLATRAMNGPGSMLSQLRHLSAAADRHDADIRALWAELRSTPPELDTLSEENALLVHHAREAAEETSAMRAAHAALKRESLECRQRVHGLQAERDALRVRLGDAERLEMSSMNVAELTASTLAVELRRGEQWEQSLEAEVGHRSKRIQDVEHRAALARQELLRLEASNAAVGEEAANVARVAVAEAERRRQRTSELETQLAKARGELRSGSERDSIANRGLAEARAEAFSLQRVTELLAAELTESERHTQEIERKALGVARELFDTSQSIARLRSEVVAQQVVQTELEEARREEGVLEQRIAEAQRSITSVGQSSNGCPPVGVGASELSILAEVEHKDLQLHHGQQEQAVNDALRAAWEAETREHRATERKLEASQARWHAMREWLARLAAVAEQWRDELLAITGAGPPLPKLWLPAESAWCDEAQFPDIVRALSDFVEVLVAESTRRLAEVSRRAGQRQDQGWHSQARATSSAGEVVTWHTSLPPYTAGAVSSLSASSER